ncbi:MAG: GTP-binding protein [Deferrisomatales bacterium]
MIVDIVYGFLGSGKTTFITRILNEWGRQERIAVLVNEFGEVGIDGDLLRGRGGNVVEMPSGCICCSLQSDFRSQILELSRTLRPDRVIIEPTGVATVSQIRSIVEAQLFEDAIDAVHDILVVDVTGFMDLYRANRHFVESQVRNAQLVLLNKCDRVDPTYARLIRDAVVSIYPEVVVLMTEFGAVEWAEYRAALSAAALPPRDAPTPPRGRPVGQEPPAPPPEAGEPTLSLHPEEDGLGLESVGYVFEGLSFDLEALRALYAQLARPDSGLGQVVRAKGIFRTGDRSVLVELSSGDVSIQPLAPGDRSKLSIIGKNLDRERIADVLNRSVSVHPV